jgi:hypothetical protein
VTLKFYDISEMTPIIIGAGGTMSPEAGARTNTPTPGIALGYILLKS